MSGDNLPLPPEGLTYYQLLGVSEDAPDKDIQKAYRQLIKVYHPDQWDHWASEDVARRLKDAYNVLTDPRKRQRYNQEGHEEFTAEPSASFSDIEDWIEGIDNIIEVENPAKLNNITKGDEGEIEVDDGFETSEDTLTAEQIFEEVEEEIVGSSFDEVQKDAKQEEQNEENPTYASEEPDVENIEDKTKEREPVEKSHEERVKERVERNSRARDPTVFSRESNETEEIPKEQTTETDSKSVKERVSNAISIPVTFFGKYLSDDVISRAVRRAWVVRTGAVLALFALVVALGELARASTGEISYIPSTEQISSGHGLVTFLVVAFVVFVFDQLNTERDNNPGDINVAKKPSIYTALAVATNATGLAIFMYAAYRGFDPYTTVMNMTEGILPVGVWTEMTFDIGPLAGGSVLNGIIAVIMTSTLSLDLLFGFAAVTRYIWYYRYVKGYRVMPLWWDYTFILFIIPSMWVLLTGATSFPIPEFLGELVVSIHPETMGVLTIEPTSVSGAGVIAVLTGVPTLVGILAFSRVKIEGLFRKILS